MKKSKFIIKIAVILSLIFVFNVLAYGDGVSVVTLGKDLNEKQREEILNLFNVNKDEVTIIEVNNQEERKYLEGIASEAQLGKITISSAYVELLEKGSGIDVVTYNISWVTEDMYRSALITAGVKDAKIIAAAPYSVSGTGALTGILKAFEQATGTKISEEQKQVANEEIVQTSELGELIGKDKASQLIREIKEKVLEQKAVKPEDIRKIIIDISGRLDINLTTDQIDQIMKLMEKINKLDLNTEQIKEQLKNIGEKLDETLKNNKEVRTLLQKILDAIKEFFASLFRRK